MIGATFCSGIGAPEVAAPWIDWRFASEIEPFPRAVLTERFGYQKPDVQNQGEPLLWGDMQTVTPDLWHTHGLPLPEIIVAGTPCQAFSIAGLRRGLDDDRGNLTMKFVEIVHEIVSARHDGQLVVLWENVPGVLSDKGNAFGSFLGGIVGASDAFTTPDGGSWPGAGMVEGPRARAVWRVLDAQYFGVAQRRRRVFVVVDFGGRVDPAAVLFECQSLQGNFTPCREGEQEYAKPVDGGTSHWSGSEVHPTLSRTTCSMNNQEIFSQGGAGLTADKYFLAFDCKGTQVQHDTVCPPLRAMGHVGSHTNGGGHAAVCVCELMDRGGALLEGLHDTAALRVASGGSSRSYITYGPIIRRMTPVECARLQGFPDTHCQITYRGRTAYDGPQYKAYGNSMAVPVVAWILDRIRKAVDA